MHHDDLIISELTRLGVATDHLDPVDLQRAVEAALQEASHDFDHWNHKTKSRRIGHGEYEAWREQRVLDAKNSRFRGLRKLYKMLRSANFVLVNSTVNQTAAGLARPPRAVVSSVSRQTPTLSATISASSGAWFSFLTLLVPARVSDEIIGDTLEMISNLKARQRPAWHIALKAVSGTFWTLVAAAKEIAAIQIRLK